MTKKQVVRKLQEHFGAKIDLWYDRSAASWVFVGECTENWDAKYSCICRLSDLTPAGWVAVAEALAGN